MQQDSPYSNYNNQRSPRSNYASYNSSSPRSRDAFKNYAVLPPYHNDQGRLSPLSDYSLSRNINSINMTPNYHKFTPLHLNGEENRRNDMSGHGSVGSGHDRVNSGGHDRVNSGGHNSVGHDRNSVHMNDRGGRAGSQMGGVGSHQTSVSIPDHGRYNYTQVNLVNHHEDWPDNTTILSGMSDNDLMNNPIQNSRIDSLHHQIRQDFGFRVQRFGGFYTCFVISVLSFFSPILMVILPQLPIYNFRTSQMRCDVECDGLLISLTFKLMCLAMGSWAVFYTKPKSTLPRLMLYRGFICLLLILVSLAFWLFYIFRIAEDKKRTSYKELVNYSMCYLESLIVLHYLALLLIHLRHQQSNFLIKVVRSPDGESSSFLIGALSIQQAAASVLDKYYSSFTIYNPYLSELPTSTKERRDTADSNYKYFNPDGGFGNYHEKDSRVGSPVFRNYSRKENNHNDLFYEEYEYDRRMKKRRARLISATDEAFSHIHRISNPDNKGTSSPMDSYEVAQTIFPSIVRPLQKYLRITRQQPRHTMDSILSHLANIIHYDMSPKAFLEKYLTVSPVLQNDMERVELQSWSLISTIAVTRSLCAGTTFQLRQGDVSLMCQVINLPHYNITEATLNNPINSFIVDRTSHQV